MNFLDKIEQPNKPIKIEIIKGDNVGYQCSLCEFFDNNDGIDEQTQKDIIYSLLLKGGYRGGGGAWAEWEIIRID